jgi:hypothetical protein
VHVSFYLQHLCRACNIDLVMEQSTLLRSEVATLTPMPYRAARFSSRLRSASSAFSCGPAAAHARRSGRDRRLGEVVQRLSVRLLREIIALIDDERDGGGT